MADKMTPQDRSGLLAASGRGGKVHTGQAGIDKLKARGLVGESGGLTARGKLERDRLARQLEDEAFGDFR